MRVFPAASNVASLNGVSGLFDTAERCALAGAISPRNTISTATLRMEPP
jgi:hypothetical protein